MSKRLIALAVTVCLLLCGCNSLLDGEFVSVRPHKIQSDDDYSENVTASSYTTLRNALSNMVVAGRTTGLIYVPEYPAEKLSKDIDRAITAMKASDPLTSYAVDSFSITQGTRGGVAALDVEINYLHDQGEIRNIHMVNNMEEALQKIKDSLNTFEVTTVLYIQNYISMDILQVIERYAYEHPQHVIEQPQVSINVYPDVGTSRVLELKFNYQTSRDSLKEMQRRVRNMFSSASLYVSGASWADEKFSQLYSFIMERFDYTIETSITPAYSLLLHGVGDSRAFATVYSAMCRQAGLECYVVSGTHNGVSYYWNIVGNGEGYYHVDLLRSSEAGVFQKLLDPDMAGYVWDYSSYPACTAPEPTIPIEPIP